MTYRTFSVSHGRDGFTLHLVKRSRTRDAYQYAVETLCEWTGHRWCGSRLVCAAIAQGESAERGLAQVPIDRATADRLAYTPEDWAYLDDEDLQPQGNAMDTDEFLAALVVTEDDGYEFPPSTYYDPPSSPSEARVDAVAWALADWNGCDRDPAFRDSARAAIAALDAYDREHPDA